MSTLEDIISSIQGSIDSTRNRIAELEAELETLKSFKSDVSTSSDDFVDVITTKNQYISDLVSDVKDNACVDTLSYGMNYSLNIVGLIQGKGAYAALLAAIDLKIVWYEAELVSERLSLSGLLGQLEDLLG